MKSEEKSTEEVQQLRRVEDIQVAPRYGELCHLWRLRTEAIPVRIEIKWGRKRSTEARSSAETKGVAPKPIQFP